MTSKAVFNFMLTQYILGAITAATLAVAVTNGLLTQADSDEIQACTPENWQQHLRH